MTFTTVIGLLASIGTSSSLLPQLFKIIKEKKAEALSIGMLLVLFAGLALWIWYGILQKDMIVIVANAFSLVVNIILLILTIKYKK
ncbi:MAG: SemiSWEET transporter [Ginsengibacter sp.]